MRLPRLFRIIRVIRFIKKADDIANTKQMQNITKALNLTSGVKGLIKIFVTVFILNHIASCLWFLLAKIDNFPPQSWVVLQGLVDEDVTMQYIQSFYWSFQTLATVGFGDISAKTKNERIFAIIWMIFGIGFYSYTIGNMTNLIASMDSSSEELQQNLSVLKEFKKRTSMPNRLFLKIKRHL